MEAGDLGFANMGGKLLVGTLGKLVSLIGILGGGLLYSDPRGGAVFFVAFSVFLTFFFAAIFCLLVQ